MKLEHKHKIWIILGIAALFIGYGLLEMVFDFNVSPKVVNNVSMILMILALGLLFSDKKGKYNNTNGTTEDTDSDSNLETSTSDSDGDNDTNDVVATQDNQENSDYQDDNRP